jgi:hypothetical protein
MVQKYGGIDVDDIRMKMDVITQEPRERVQTYFGRLDKMFRKGQIPDVEQKRRFLARLRPEIRKLCIVQTFADIEELVGAAVEVEGVLAELGETPYEPLKEEQEEEAEETTMEKQIDVLNNTLIHFFKRNALDPEPSSYSTMSEECQICGARGHIATSCPRLNEARLKYAECNMPHRVEGGEIKSTYCAGLEHSEDEYWEKPRFGAANFLETLQDDEAATAIDAATPCEVPRTETYDARRKQEDDVEDEGCTEAVAATKEVGSLHKEATVHQDRAPLADNENDNFCEGVNGLTAAELIGAIRDLEKTNTLAVGDIDIENKFDAGMKESSTPVLPPSAVEEDPEDPRTMVRCTDEQQTYVTRIANELVDVPIAISEQGDTCSRMEHSVEVMEDNQRIEVECGMLISEHLVSGRIQTLPPPRLKDHDAECLPGTGRWNMMHREMINGGIVKHWTCINLPRYVTVDITHQSYNELTLMCRMLGMMCGIKPVLAIQGVEPGQHEDTSLKVLTHEGDQSLSNMGIEVLNEDEVPDEPEEISNAPNSTDEYKKAVERPAAIPDGCAVQNELKDNHAPIEDSKGSKKCGLLRTGRCEFATNDGEMDSNGITETPTNGFGMPVWRAVHDLTLISTDFRVVIFPRLKTIRRGWKEECAGETSVKQMTEPQCIGRSMNPRRGRTNAPGLWMEEGCWIYFIQVANGRMWARTCRGLQIHHDAPD